MVDVDSASIPLCRRAMLWSKLIVKLLHRCKGEVANSEGGITSVEGILFQLIDGVSELPSKDKFLVSLVFHINVFVYRPFTESGITLGDCFDCSCPLFLTHSDGNTN